MDDFSHLKTKDFFAALENLPEVAAFVKSVMSECGCGHEMISSVDIAVEEVYVNIASYAYDEDAASKPVWVSCGETDKDFILLFRDEGIPYDPLKTEDPVTGDPQKMTIGGYGIFMVKTIADSVTYEYDHENGQNVLVIKKKIQ
ncbi:MAG: ATP-binding protein [Lachnospiraceae bacterium]|nr:ATP-binding protein [Lachnospiraceae bacterium]